MRTVVLPLVLALAFVGCGSDGAAPEGAPPSTVVPRGNRMLAVALTLPEQDDLDAAVQLARSAGMQGTIVSLAWDELEPRPGEYDASFLPVLQAYAIATGLPLHVTLSTIDTNVPRLPIDLAGLSFDDPRVAERFRPALDFFLDQFQGVQVTGLSIGNEVDAWLGADPARWAAYRRFFETAAAHARERGLRVGVKATFDGLTGHARDELLALNRLTDVVLVTYYPLAPDFSVRDPSEVRGDVDALTALYPGRPIEFLEAGYPTSAVLGSSNARQREFVVRMFEAWDAHATQIETVSFFALSDLSEEQVQGFQSYYGVPDARFGQFLLTLGLRTFPGAGADKEAFRELRDQAARRGWPTG